MRLELSLLALGALACGARSDLSAERDRTESVDEPVDASIDASDDPEPAWTEGVWWFGTVRAICDTFAVAFCGDGEVAARWSRDDGCLGENPTTPGPIRGRVVSADADRVTLRFDVPMGALEPSTVRLEAGAEPVRTLALDFEPARDFITFPWGEGRRPTELGIAPAVVSEFVSCD